MKRLTIESLRCSCGTLVGRGLLRGTGLDVSTLRTLRRLRRQRSFEKKERINEMKTKNLEISISCRNELDVTNVLTCV